jgi:isoquinoline 1-oxidoreductase beta subunit
VRIDPHNTVTLGLVKQEMGQGVETGLPMILADELGADWQMLKVEPIVFDSALRLAAARRSAVWRPPRRPSSLRRGRT